WGALPACARRLALRQPSRLSGKIPVLPAMDPTAMSLRPAPLTGIRVLDLTRVLAGPWCTQNLADLGAEVIKIERPGAGDDTRGWGPPYVKDQQGADTTEAAYYASANRNKQSVALDIATPRGAELIRE